MMFFVSIPKKLFQLCCAVAFAIGMFSSCALASTPPQDASTNSNASVVFENKPFQADTLLSHDFENNLQKGVITNSNMLNIFSHANNQNNLTAFLNTDVNSNVIGYIQKDTETVPYTSISSFITAINNESAADVYLCESIIINNSIKIKEKAQITIYLCGHVLYGSDINTSGVENKPIIEVKNNANLSIIGSSNETEASQAHTLNGFDKEGDKQFNYIISGGAINAGQDDDVIGMKISGNNSTVTLKSTTIFGCSDTEDEGAGINICGENTQLCLDSSKIQHCRADSGGGIYLEETAINSSISMAHSSIDNNHADDYGAGICCKAESANIQDTAYSADDESTRSTISYNNADNYGAGIYSIGAQVMVYGFRINNNNADVGGGMCSWADINTISDCVFRDNYASYGGGIDMRRLCDITSISSCSFYNNIAATDGGAAYIDSEDNIFDGCIFSGNFAEWSGGAVCIDAEDNWFKGCTFTGNTANDTGGAMRINAADDNTTVTSCEFKENMAYDGGGVYVDSQINHFTGCTFTKNKADNKGGGVCVDNRCNYFDKCTFTSNEAETGGGLRINWYDDKTEVTSCGFYDNIADNGGGAYVDSEDNTFDKCTFTGNTSEQAGSALYDKGFHNTLNNCTITGNISKAKTGAVYVYSFANIFLGGVMYISDNTGHGVYLASLWFVDANIKIDTSEFDISSWVGVYVEDGADINKRISISGSNEDKYLKRFFKE